MSIDDRARRALVATFAVTAFVAATLAVEACGGDDRPGASNGDVGPGVDASRADAGGGTEKELEAGIVDGDTDAGVVTCPGPALGGQAVAVRSLGGVPPADTGGSIATGTYDLTDVQVYAGLGEPGDSDAGPDAGASETARATLVLAADTFSLASTSTSAATGTASTVSIGKHRTDDVFLVVDETCPTTDSRQTPFTATPTTLTLHTAQSRLEVFTRRP